MPAASILPVALHNQKLYFLFGKENALEESAKGFSDFGGGIEPGETPFQTAVREGSEELTGFLGTPKMLQTQLRKSGTYKITHTFKDRPNNTYTVFIFPFMYEPKLVEYFNNNHTFLWKRMNKHVLSQTKLFEKIVLEWFCEDELEKRADEYRPFYKEIVHHIIDQKEKIRKFIENKCKKQVRTIRKRCFTCNKTRNIRGGK